MVIRINLSEILGVGYVPAGDPFPTAKHVLGNHFIVIDIWTDTW